MNFFDALCKVVQRTNQPPHILKNEAYSVTPPHALKFMNCGHGLYISQFASIYSGILLLSPGAIKGSAKSKDSPLKFFVLQGEVEVKCAEDVIHLKTLDFLEVKADINYSLKNASKEDVYIQFTRDLERTTDKQTTVSMIETEESQQDSSSDDEDDAGSFFDESYSPSSKFQSSTSTSEQSTASISEQSTASISEQSTETSRYSEESSITPQLKPAGKKKVKQVDSSSSRVDESSNLSVMDCSHPAKAVQKKKHNQFDSSSSSDEKSDESSRFGVKDYSRPAKEAAKKSNKPKHQKK